MRALKISKNNITNNQSENLNKYFFEINKNCIELTPDEEFELFELFNIDDTNKEKIKLQIFYANCKFVISVAKQYQHFNINLLDLINEGNIGLLKAIDKFDNTKGYKFISYAVWWIRQNILECVSNNRNIRLPINKIGKFRNINNKIAELEQIYETNNASIYLSDYYDQDEINMFHLIENTSTVSSLDELVSDENLNSSVGNLITSNNLTPDEILIRKESHEMLHNSMKYLKNIELLIISHIFGLDGKECLKYSEIAKELNISYHTVKNSYLKILKKIKNNLTTETITNNKKPFKHSIYTSDELIRMAKNRNKYKILKTQL